MPDVLVLGRGPAGLLAAVRLARSGARVQVVGRQDGRQRIEGASPRVAALLEGIGLKGDALSSATLRNASWGELPAAPNREHVVDRLQLERDLTELARSAGVVVTEAGIGRLSTRRRVETSAGSLSARHVVEARGRRAPSRRDASRGPRSIAISGWTAFPDASRERQAGTRVMATRLGWLWTATTPQGRHWAQVSVDAGSVGYGKHGLRACWEAFVAQTGVPALPFPAAPLVRACEMRLTAPELDPDGLRVGDAAVALDPLSGHGMFWALSSALMLPPILQAIEAGDAGLARRFYADRVADTFWRQARVARDFYAMCPEWADTPFWSARKNWPDDLPAHRALTRARIVRKVIVDDGRLRETDVLETPQEPGGAAFVRGIPLAPVLKRLKSGHLPQRDAFVDLVPDLPPSRAAFLHDWLVSRGLPVAVPSRSEPMETHS